jgi:hypothetical protein
MTQLTLSTMTDDELADRRDELRTKLSELARAEDEIRAEKDSIDQEFISRFTSRGSTATKTSLFTISARENDRYPELVDRNAFEAYVLANKALYLLQSRLSMKEIQDELAAGGEIPGVRLVKRITINQVKRPQKKVLNDND